MSSPEWLSWIWANRDEIIRLGTPVIGLIGGAVGIWLLYIRTRAADRTAKTAAERHEEQTRADRERRITESFIKAVEQLSSDQLLTRLAGIYTLDHIAGESERHYWPIMDTLTTYVHERAPWPPRLANYFVQLQNGDKNETAGESVASPKQLQGATPSFPTYADFRLIRIMRGFPVRQSTRDRHRPVPDIQAVVDILVRPEAGGKRIAAERQLNLPGKDLRGANLGEAHLEGANFREAHLEGAWLSKARLKGARLSEAHLEDAFLMEAHLEGADLSGASLEGATLWKAHLRGAGERSKESFDFETPPACVWEAHLEYANLSEAHLEGAELTEARLEGAYLIKAHLEGARLRKAHLEGATLWKAHLESTELSEARLEGTDLRGAHLGGTNLRGAHLEGASLLGAQSLKQEQLEEAFGDDRTVLPEDLTRPAWWPKAVPDAPDTGK